MRWTNRWNSRRPEPAAGRLAEDEDCGAARAALSAQVDGESEPPMTQEIAEHLADCLYCAAWQESLHRLTRRVRLTSAPALPDRTPELLAAVLADRTAGRPARPTYRMLRWGLVGTAAAQLLISIPALILGQAGALVPAQAAHELGAFNLALAVGFVGAALRPARARGALWLVAPATALLVLLAIVDSALGRTTLVAETPHLIAVAGWAMLAALARAPRVNHLAGSNRAGGQR
jgi:predicted anti-sigma-YlaC factor YlaD